MTRKKQVRKRYLLYKGFQLRFMLVIILAMVCIALATGLSIYTTVMTTLATQFHGESLALIKHAVTYKILIRSVLLIFAIAIISVFLSHHIAGPIYKFEQTVKALSQGEKVDEIKLRKGDEFYHLARALNELIHSLNKGG